MYSDVLLKSYDMYEIKKKRERYHGFNSNIKLNGV